MRSKWFHLKEEALALRESGMSMTVIERKLGIPRSTLSLWFKKIVLSDEQKALLTKNKADGWAKARMRAVESHRAHKALRLLEAKRQAEKTLSKLEITHELIDIGLAMLYYGEGAKSDRTSLANSDPKILRFFLAALASNYQVTALDVRCELHLRADQDGEAMKLYWSKELGIPLDRFRHIAYDQRTSGRPTYDHYKGVCVITCKSVAIQRKLTYLYNLFCDKVTELNLGA
jgi:hypothetical protein